MPTETISFEPLLNSVQAAALLGIHPKTLQKMARDGTHSRLQDWRPLALPRIRPQ